MQVSFCNAPHILPYRSFSSPSCFISAFRYKKTDLTLFRVKSVSDQSQRLSIHIFTAIVKCLYAAF